MTEMVMPREKITRLEVEVYKREVLERSMLMSPQEASRILSCSESTIYRLVKSGRLHGYAENRGTKGLRILAAALCEYVQSIKIDHDAWRE